MTDSLKLVFMGTPEFAIPCLAALAEARHQIQAIYTQPDRPSGRGQRLTGSAVKNWGQVRGIPIYQPLDFKNQQTVEELRDLEPDVLIVIAYGLLLPPSVLSIPKYGAINVHASLLPRWRGAAPIQYAILHGDKESGVTIMQMDQGMDTGDILDTCACPMEPDENAETLHDKIAKIAVEPLLSTLDALQRSALRPKAQDDKNATYAKKIKKTDAQIHWQQTAVEIDRMIRAYYPWPIAYFPLGQEFIRIHQAKVELETSAAKPGTILKLDKSGLLVATKAHCLRIQQIQFPGKKVISIFDCLNTKHCPFALGQVLP